MLYRHSGDGETATGVSDSTPEESETISREESGDVRGGEKHEIGTCLKAFLKKVMQYFTKHVHCAIGLIAIYVGPLHRNTTILNVNET